jgi:hypothetical protein
MKITVPDVFSLKSPTSVWKVFTGLLVVCILERLVLFLIYPPVSYSDTGSYRRLAETVVNGWVNYDGTRTPVYPVFFGGDWI